jgi:hypothetical protein
MHRSVTPLFPREFKILAIIAVLFLLFAIAGNMGFKDEQDYAALSCQMVKAGKWPASYCENRR